MESPGWCHPRRR